MNNVTTAAAAAAAGQPAQNRDQQPAECLTAKDQSSKNKDGEKDQLSEMAHEEEQGDALDFVFDADGVAESNEASKEGDDFQLQIEWMLVPSSLLQFRR